MWHISTFVIWFVGWCLISAWRGGAAEKLAAGLQVIAFATTLAANFLGVFGAHHLYQAVHLDVWLIDTMLLIALYILAIRSTRFWPMWITAIQLLAVLSHIVRMIDPEMTRLGYFGLVNFLAWPMIGITGYGAIRHHARRKTYGSDPSFARS